uniref:Uncharacterized protein n=1 Tax=uncultured Thiotrichaceae bacterium TaxID=298394 RepID=A0A6S6U596_9GAMM|nr:MAG: Unknown protein [uncultured Thiotrichaceae bacterium]
MRGVLSFQSLPLGYGRVIQVGLAVRAKDWLDLLGLALLVIFIIANTAIIFLLLLIYYFVYFLLWLGNCNPRASHTK